MEIISYGGGVQTTALAILNATGKVTPGASHAVFADTGSEFADTYQNIVIMGRWLGRRGIEMITIQSRDGSLEDYVRERSTPIPVRYEGGIGRRQCTSKWKVEPIQQWLRAQGAEEAIIQLGISLDEFHRMKPNPAKWLTNRFPLIDAGLTRSDCIQIIREAELPVPPPSSCVFCPFHTTSFWQNMAVFQPDEFERAAQVEDVINERKDYKARDRVYLSSRLKPLRKAFNGNQLPLPGMDAPDDHCGGFCHV